MQRLLQKYRDYQNFYDQSFLDSMRFLLFQKKLNLNPLMTKDLFSFPQDIWTAQKTDKAPLLQKCSDVSHL